MAGQPTTREKIEEEGPESDSPDDEPRRRHKRALRHQWKVGFLRGSGFSIRRRHARRRSVQNDECFAQFLANLEVIFDTYPLDRIVNADETTREFINNRIVIVAEYGVKGITCEFEGDVKASTPVIATIMRRDSKESSG
jgi:hypothetical protein